MLLVLSVSADRALSHIQLLKRVWGIGHTGGRGSVRTYCEAAPPLAGRGRRQTHAPLQGSARRLSDAEGAGAVTVRLSVLGSLQVHHPRVPEFLASIVYCECSPDAQDTIRTMRRRAVLPPQEDALQAASGLSNQGRDVRPGTSGLVLRNTATARGNEQHVVPPSRTECNQRCCFQSPRPAMIVGAGSPKSSTA